MMRLLNKVVIVTGGANGIGRTYTASLCSEGARVLIADIDIEAATALADTINQSIGFDMAAACRVDVTSEDDTQQMAAMAQDRFGQIDVLLNNAGTYPHVDFEDIDYDAWRKVITVNLDSVFLCTRAVLPIMKAQGAGKIINVATNLVWVGLPGMVHYIAAKSGIIGFTRSLAREIGEYGITVNAIAPGAVIPDGQLNEVSRRRVEMIVDNQSVKRPQKSEDLVGMMIFLASSDADFVSGQIFTVDGGLTTH
jgi:NAD(P)-dependent dehydrogenase (short-subunit alcohol dehydrogenase family)